MEGGPDEPFPCHGAPGRSSEGFASGLNPSPPYLPTGEVQKELTHPELFWVVKNGIKMTGMPAFGGHHDDRALWAIAAFVRKLAEVTPEAYAQMVEKRSHGDGGK